MEIKVDDYGDMLSVVTGKKLISFKRFGSYQGEWIATLDSGENIEIWKGYYGSCSGCDWIEAEKNYEKDTISLEKAKEFFKENRPFAVIPKETIGRIDGDTFEQMLPKNIRADIYEFSSDKLLKDIKEGLSD